MVGSGPAGMAAAQQLARAGHDVTVFEKNDRIGGLLRYGIPDFKMEKSHIDRRVEQMQAEGVTFRPGVMVGHLPEGSKVTNWAKEIVSPEQLKNESLAGDGFFRNLARHVRLHTCDESFARERRAGNVPLGFEPAHRGDPLEHLRDESSLPRAGGRSRRQPWIAAGVHARLRAGVPILHSALRARGRARACGHERDGAGDGDSLSTHGRTLLVPPNGSRRWLLCTGPFW